MTTTLDALRASVRICPVHRAPVVYRSSAAEHAPGLCPGCIHDLRVLLADDEWVDRAAIEARLAALREGRL